MKPNRRYQAVIPAIVLCLLLPAAVGAAGYAGIYSNNKLSVSIAAAGDGYVGEITLAGQKFPLTARDDGTHLAGSFVSAGNAFQFSATQRGDDLTLTTGNAIYQLHRPTNPLETGQPTSAVTPSPVTAPPPASPVAAAPASANPLAAYTVVNETDVGRSLMLALPNTKTTRAALRVVFPDLARYFGARPTILGAYDDQKEHQTEFVSFSAQINGQPIKGFVTAKLSDQGTVAYVVYGKQNATSADWSKLTTHAAGGAGAPVSEEDAFKQKMAEVPLTTYTFPDGTGAIGLADGYTTQAQTESNLRVTGPAGQVILMAFGGTMNQPGSFAAQRGFGTIGAYAADPATALAHIIQATSVMNQRKGGPTLTPERVLRVIPVKPSQPGGVGAQITYDVTVTDQAGPKPMRVLIQLETHPPQMGSWGYYVSLQLIAPRETFPQDLPVMMAQAFSLSENAAAVQAKVQREIQAANQLAQAQRDANQKIAQAHYDQTKSVEDNERIKMRTNADFDEVIRGTRKIEDTQTGEQATVDLADVHNIVDNMNYYEPGRYKEIPLRDELYPTPGRENEPDYVGR